MTGAWDAVRAEHELESALLLAVAAFVGVLPDDLVVATRHLAVAGEVEEAVEALTSALVQGRLAVTDLEREQLEQVRDRLGLDRAAIAGLPRTGPRLPVFLVDGGPDAEAADAAGVVAGPADLAVLDRLPLWSAAVAGVWRGWRYPATATASLPPRAVYVVEVPTEDAVRMVVHAWYRSGRPGPDGPLVEPYVTGRALPGLAVQVRSEGVLVYVPAEPVFQEAEVFAAPPSSGAVALSPRLPAAEADWLADRLERAPRILERSPEADDALDPGRPGIVPRGVRTDGRWLWSEESVYYLREHRIGPPEPFLEYLRGEYLHRQDHTVPDAVAALAQRWWFHHDPPGWPPARPAVPQDVPAALHRLVNRLEDALPDPVVATVRQLIASGQAAQAAGWLGLIVTEGRPALSPVERDVLSACLDLTGHVERADAVRQLPMAGPRRPGNQVRIGPGDDGPDELAVWTPAMVDADVATLLASTPGVLAAWRAGRQPAVPAGQDPARSVYLVECAGDEGMAAVLAAWYGAGGRGGQDPFVVTFPSMDAHPLMVPFVSGEVHPPWHADVMTAGLLVYAAGVPGELGVASMVVDDESPRLPPREAAALVARLAAGRVFGRLNDAASAVLADAAAPGAVPLTLRTDGRWIWADAIVYYLSRYGMPPDPAFLDYLRRTPAPTHAVPELAGALAMRALRLVSAGLTDGVAVPGALLAPARPGARGTDPRLVRRWLDELVQGTLDVLADADVDAVHRALADGRLEQATRHLGHAIAAAAPITVMQAHIFATIAEALGLAPDEVPGSAGAAPDTGRHPRLTLTARAPHDPPSGGLTARVDEAVLPTLYGVDGVVGVWRAWRHANSRGQQTRAVYLVEARNSGALHAVYAAVHGPQWPSGPGNALIEVFLQGNIPPLLLDQVIAQGELVHIGVPEPDFQLAPSVALALSNMTGPALMTTITSELDAVDTVTYLSSGRTFATGGVGGPSAPRELYTDGTWIWSYELVHHALNKRSGPPSALADYLRTRPRVPPPISETVVVLAQRWLRRTAGTG
ncbi:hypothetical protein [Dactylosporangium matsuzakiense]|uniref:Uncharacterized protein n=1 Tax=Dactylosporangium matsuzakiense TaxID=53360 RepID=A0A9W6NT49_9ACTN|nr:hypothetical protein [Dactylosporangium matsuzakiense]GLL08158.1 hypothetical protein GCM10017581_099180 [Dactylosporangium matsuzakiense]